VLNGDLSDNRTVASTLDTLWDGMETWAVRLHRTFAKVITEKDAQ
jgi:hypothetical protein